MADYFVSEYLSQLQKQVGSTNSVTADTPSFLPLIREAANEIGVYEARWKKAVFFSPIAICVVSAEGKFLEVNPAACDLFERSRSELLDLTWQEITDSAYIDGDGQMVSELIDNKVESYKMFKLYIMPDGARKRALLSVSKFEDTEGREFFISQIIDLEWMALQANWRPTDGS